MGENSIQPLNEISKLFRTMVIFPRCIIKMLTSQRHNPIFFRGLWLNCWPSHDHYYSRTLTGIERSQTNIISLNVFDRKDPFHFPPNFPKYKMRMQLSKSSNGKSFAGMLKHYIKQYMIYLPYAINVLWYIEVSLKENSWSRLMILSFEELSRNSKKSLPSGHCLATS